MGVPGLLFAVLSPQFQQCTMANAMGTRTIDGVSSPRRGRADLAMHETREIYVIVTSRILCESDLKIDIDLIRVLG